MRRFALAQAAVLLLIATIAHSQSQFDSEDYKLRVTKVVQGLYHPWGMAFSPVQRCRCVDLDGTAADRAQPACIRCRAG